MIRGEDQTGDPQKPGYELIDEALPAPPLPGDVVVTKELDELLDKIAADLVVHAENCVRQFGDFHLALSVGGPLERLYERLMYDPDYRRLPWRRTHLWFVDEIVTDEGPANFQPIYETIGLHADIPHEQFHPIATTADTTTDYETVIKESLSWREKGQDRLDCVLLNLREDGGVAGLRPEGSAIDETRRFVISDRPADDTEHITMTFHLLNAARLIMVMATGERTTSAVDRTIDPETPMHLLPAKGIVPISGELRWYLDKAAAASG